MCSQPETEGEGVEDCCTLHRYLGIVATLQKIVLTVYTTLESVNLYENSGILRHLSICKYQDKGRGGGLAWEGLKNSSFYEKKNFLFKNFFVLHMN